MLTAPAWVWLTVFFLAPVGVVVWYSLGTSPPPSSGLGRMDTSVLSLDRYGDVFGGPILKAFTNTLWISVAGTTACLLLAVPVAYWLAVRASQRMRIIGVVLVALPFWINALIRTLSWRVILAPNGVVSEWLLSVGVIDAPLGILGTRTGVLLGVIYNYLPLAVLPLFVSFLRMDPRLREAGQDLYATPARTFWGITLPLALPGIRAAALLVFIPLAGDYVTATILGGTSGTMAGTLVVTQFLSAQDWAQGSATAVILIGLILGTVVVMVAAQAVVEVAGRAADSLPLRRRGPGRRPRRRRPIGGAVLTVGVIVFLYLPILIGFVQTFSAARSFTTWGGFTLGNYGDAWADSQIRGSLRTSLEVAAVSAVVAVLIGTPAGIGMARRPRSLSTRGLTAVVALVLVTPEIVAAIAQLLWLTRLGGPFLQGLGPIDPGLVRMVVAHSLLGTAVVVLVVRATHAGHDVTIEEAAADLSATPVRTLRDVTLPILRPAILAGGFLAFSLSLDTTVISSFLGTAKSLTYPALLFAQVKNVVGPRFVVAGFALTLLTIVSVTLVAAALTRANRSGGDGILDDLL